MNSTHPAHGKDIIKSSKVQIQNHSFLYQKTTVIFLFKLASDKCQNYAKDFRSNSNSIKNLLFNIYLIYS